MKLQQPYLLLLIGLFCIVGCSACKMKVVNWENDAQFKTDNGILFYNNIEYSGRIDEFYNNSSQKKSESFYAHGKLSGQKKVWFQNGQLSEVRFYINGFKSGEHLGWWANDSARFVYHFNDEGQYEGEILDWFENGLPYREMNYKNGKEVGYQKIWNNKGKLIGNYSVVNGERFGLVNFKNCYTVVNSKNQVGKNE